MRKFFLFVLLIMVGGSLVAQVDISRFEKEIRAFEKEDSALGINRHAILFAGSSSIRLWSSLEKDMFPLSVLNRGFGGSTLPELIHYADRIILPYKPDIIVLYCGENDLANDETSADQVYNNFKKFYKYLRKQLPTTRLYYISIKPSVKRWEYWPKFKEANQKIAKFMRRHKRCYYIDTASKMLDENGVVYQDIFVEDKLHMNAKGYAIWTGVLKPALQIAYYPKPSLLK